ncbi:MAG: aminotransferase class IV [Actinomycetota bacterium]|nr:aminotransferase class IV [Actinomycetota bacterium]
MRLGPRPLPRPDPSVGVFETLRVENGRPVELHRHLARLEASVSDLYDASLPPRLVERIAAQIASQTANSTRPSEPPSELPSGRLRISYLPGSGGRPADVRTEVFPMPDDPGVVSLAPVTVPGGLGPHKWRDRILLDALTEHVSPATPLLVDVDGQILEAAWANVFIVTPNGETATPPLDGRILPGVGREQIIRRRQADGDPVAERPIALDELRIATSISLVNSLRGSLPARVVD